MDALLTHLVQMTAQRDQSLLDRALLLALQDLAGIRDARVLELFHFQEEQLMRPSAWLRDGALIPLRDCEAAHRGELVRNHVALSVGLRSRQDWIEHTTPAGAFILWLPVRLREEACACIEIVLQSSPDAETRRLLEGLAGVYRNHRSILDYSEHDSLTGLLNRKTFDEKFSRLLAADLPSSPPQGQCERRDGQADKSHWLAVLDIDHFKRVNDQFGHLYGDEVLILIANLLRLSFRTQDRIFRFGGEEFVVLLRSASLAEARRIFERFRKKVEDHHFPQVGGITVSLGFARITAETPVQILGHADQALYYAKANGRNRVCHYDELVEAGLLSHASANKDAVEFF